MENLEDEVVIDEIAILENIMKPNNLEKERSRIKDVVFKNLWKFSVNFCDILGLLDIFPCSTIHSIKPYISYCVDKM